MPYIYSMQEMPASHPAIRKLIAATFPDYRRRKVMIWARSNVTLSGLNWDGGSRSEYAGCTLDGQPTGNASRFHRFHPADNPGEGRTIAVPTGCALVQGGTYCGRPATLYIYVNPEDMPRLIS
jgi:hypothetical protein